MRNEVYVDILHLYSESIVDMPVSRMLSLQGSNGRRNFRDGSKCCF